MATGDLIFLQKFGRGQYSDRVGLVIESSCIFFQLSVEDISNISKVAEREDKKEENRQLVLIKGFEMQLLQKTLENSSNTINSCFFVKD